MYEGRIARFDGPGKPFTIEKVSLADVGPGEILIKVTRANICGSDLHAWHGTFETRGSAASCRPFSTRDGRSCRRTW